MARAAAAAKKAAPKSTAVPVTLALPELAKGEVLAGVLIEKGVLKHFVVLLPGEAESITWKEAKKWAEKQGGELPTRKEQALLFANAAEHFQPRWYWSGEQHAGSESYAWYQVFDNGYQHWNHVGNDGSRARAVRRVPIK